MVDMFSIIYIFNKGKLILIGRAYIAAIVTRFYPA